jgi:hypothetical protein
MKAVLCARFHIPWDRYGQLTGHEIRVLLQLLEDEQRAAER